jgi:lipoprotein-anchoring transpeptidase ErfK/SrfK
MGQSVLSHHKKLLMAMTASFALLAGLASSADAFPFEFRSRLGPAPNFSGQGATLQRTKPGQVMTALREKPAAKEAKENPGDVAKKANGVLTIFISIDKQQLTLYSDGVPIAHSRVSTGTGGHPTPTGVFSVIQKDRWHRSNLYGNAPMYFMQRITWSGVAMHEGVVPNHPASHGCIRLPGAFARQLWGITKLGVRVVVARGELTPAAISHDRLFTRKVETQTLEAKQAPAESSSEMVKAAYNALQESTEKREASSPTPKTGNPALDAMAYSNINIINEPGKPKSVTDAPAIRPLKPGPISVFISRKEGKLFVRKGFEPVFNMPVTFEQPERPLGTHVFTALAVNEDNSVRWNVASFPAGSAPRKTGKNAKHEQAVPVGPASSAAEALQRVVMPPEAIDRISELMTAGASLIISDQGISYETGAGTDFIVLTR